MMYHVCTYNCRMHSAAMTSPDGIVFMFGQNTHGQVGVVGVKSLMIPTDINLGHPPHHQMTEKVCVCAEGGGGGMLLHIGQA